MKPDDPCPFPREEIPEDILAWARQTFDEEDFMDQVREIEETGGIPFEDVLAELDAQMRST